VFVSVGMLEHVGLTDYRTLGGVIGRVLTDRGRGFLHFIGRNQPAPLNPWIRKRIFPGAYPPTLREVFERLLEPENLAVLDVENLRLHYGKTLEHWRQRFNDAAPRVASMFDETFVRAWQLYWRVLKRPSRPDRCNSSRWSSHARERHSMDARRLIDQCRFLRVFVAI
jgi:cyclopropane-fatty-acyl-phospholipid synthase